MKESIRGYNFTGNRDLERIEHHLTSLGYEISWRGSVPQIFRRGSLAGDSAVGVIAIDKKQNLPLPDYFTTYIGAYTEREEGKTLAKQLEDFQL